MTRQFYSIITQYGESVIAQAIANNTPVPLSTMAIGDGNGTPTTPSESQTTLINEVYRAEITDLLQDSETPNQVIAELLVPETVGGFTVREVGIYDDQNKLVAVANCPENYKPVLEQGSGKVQYYRIVLRVSSSDAVTLSLNNNIVYATRLEFNRFVNDISKPDGFKLVGECESIAQLRTVEPTEDQQRILVKSYYVGKNLGGGVFYADFADTTTADNTGTVIVTAGGKRWKRIHTAAVVEDFGAKSDKVNDDSLAFEQAAIYAKKAKIPFVANGKYKLTKVINLREIEVQAGSCDILLEEDGQLILGGHANSGFNPVQTLGKVMEAKLVLDPAPYTRPTIRCIGAKNQVITIKSTNYLQLYMSTDPDTFPRDASIAYSTFNLNFLLKLEITTDPRFNSGANRDGAGSANQWCNENIFNLNRCWALILSGSYRHNCNYFLGGSFEGAKSFIDVQTGNKNQFIHTRLESVGWVRFGENTEGNVLSRSYFSSISRVALNVEDHGVLNRVETAALEKGQATRVMDINPFSVRFNNSLLDTDVSRFIRAIKHYGTIAESDTFRMVGRKDILIFNTDNRNSRYQIRAYIFDKLGRPLNVEQVKINSNFLQEDATRGRFAGTMHGDEEYGIYRFMFETEGEYYVKIVLAASKNKDDGYSLFFTADLYSDRVRSISQAPKIQVSLAEPTKYIGFKGDIIRYPTGQITVIEHIHTSIVQKNSEQLTVMPLLADSHIEPNDVIGIENEQGEYFWSKVSQVDNHTIQLADNLPAWVSVGDKIYLSRFQYATLRRDYQRRINGTAPEHKDKVVEVTGSVTLYPDGRIEQIFHFKSLSYTWFNQDGSNIATRAIPVNFWTAMPNKVTNVTAKSLKSSSNLTSVSDEAAEWIVEWGFQHQRDKKGYSFINASRFRGNADEAVDLYVIVEGY
ncbi:phage tail protein [Mannheimia haemolytica]